MDLVARGLTDLQAYIEHLEANNFLARVKSEVDPHFELAGIAKKFEGDKVVLFENVKGCDYPVLIGLYWNLDVMASIFGCTSAELPFLLSNEIVAWAKDPMEPVIVESGPANEVIETEVDLDKLPIPHHAVGDGGRYITSSVVISKDPDTGVRNSSIHRMMVTGKDRVTLLLEEAGHVRDYQKRTEARGEPLEVTINNGVDYPGHMSAAVQGSVAPIGADETGVISQMRGTPVELLKAQTVGVEAIANAQFVLEGRILPKVREPEGPYFEVTGYYADREDRWVLEVTGITRRENPIFHTILSGREVRKAAGMMAGASYFNKIHELVPEVSAVHFVDDSMPYHLVVRMDKKHQGRERDAILAAFASSVYIKTVTVVDEDVDIYDPLDVDWAVQTRCRYDQDLLEIPESFGHRLNPMVEGDKWTRLGIDATVPIPRPEIFDRASMMDVDLSKYEITGC